MASETCRWGILGTAGIARKNWKAINLSSNATIAAVGSRTQQRAEQFIQECSAQSPPGSLPTACGSYEALLERDDIDAVYIPLPTGMRHEWVIKAAEAGKHVIGEKPAAINATQVAEMLSACRQHGVQYMDGVMFMHSRRLPLVRQLLDDQGKVGTLRRMASHFSFAGNEEFSSGNIRVHSELEPYGCLGDLGWYCSRFFLWVMNGQMPERVTARILSTLQGSTSSGTVPGEFSAELFFPDGVSASFYCSFITENQQWIHLSGSGGYVRIHDFVLPYHGPEVDVYLGQDRFEVDNCEFHMENHLTRLAAREYDAGEQSAQEVNMIRNFSEMVLSRNLDESWPDWTLKTQQILDACYQSAGRDGSAVELKK